MIKLQSSSASLLLVTTIPGWSSDFFDFRAYVAFDPTVKCGLGKFTPIAIYLSQIHISFYVELEI